MIVNDRAKLFDKMVKTMKDLDVSVRRRDIDLASCLFFTGDETLVKLAMALVDRYPDLGFRPIKAATYVHHREILPTALGWEKRPARDEDAYEISRTVTGVFVCTCLDFHYNLKAIKVASGPPQQPCCHILAAALSYPELLEVFIDNRARKPLPLVV